MKKLRRYTKETSRAISGGYRGLRRAIHSAAPHWASRKLGRTLDYFDLVFVDHHIFRFVYSNSHEIAPGVWRSSQPAPYQIRQFKRKGVRTVINLRGPRDCGSYRLERAACRHQGIHFVDFQMVSRGAPKKDVIHAAARLFREIEYPVLMHCKSGADRVGLMSALYMILKEGRPAEDALSQLSIRYGHFKEADTGILDFFLQSYIDHNRHSPMAFLDWVDNVYDPKQLKRDFRAKGGANLIVNTLLRRE